MPWRQLAWRVLSAKYAEEQSNTRRAQRVAKHARRQALAAARGDAESRPGSVCNLGPPRAAYKEVFRGRLVVDGHRFTFIEEDTWFEVTVEEEKRTGKRDTEQRRNEKLYLALRAAHAKARRQSCAQAKRRGFELQLPQTTGELEVKRRESTGHLVYAFNNFEAPVTPRKLRDTPHEEQSRWSQARRRESTPDRALRKLREKIKRSLNKATRGEHEAIVARTAFNKTSPSTMGANVGPQSQPLEQLDDPTVLGHLREYFEFLGSARLFHCKVCDEEWPVFDREWPQAGVTTAGALAGVCETIQRACFVQDGLKNDCCSRCAPRRSSYRRQYSDANLQHLRERHPAISA